MPLSTRLVAMASAAAGSATVRQYRTCIVGAGPTGAIVSALLAPAAAARLPTPLATIAAKALTQSVPSSTQAKGSEPLQVEIYDKAKGAGGRMSTSRATGEAKGATVDIGAQYLTRFERLKLVTSSVKDWFTNLESAGVLQPMTAPVAGLKDSHKSLKNFVAPEGMSAVVKYFIAQSSATLVAGKEVVSLELSAEAGEHEHAESPGATWTVKCADGTETHFDAVVLTMPVPQLLALKGDIEAVMTGAGVKEALDKIKYSSRFALALFFAPEAWSELQSTIPYGGKSIALPAPWNINAGAH
jgi:predicted NAD/FAD-dependent oxidoreductase